MTLNIKLSVIVVLFSYIYPNTASSGLQCYRCTIVPPGPYSNQTERLCSNFDYSNRYIVDCPYSTFCMKKEYEVKLSGASEDDRKVDSEAANLWNTESIRGVIRDCAQQEYKYQAYVNGKWELQTSIEEPYKEGCQYENDKGARSAVTQYCYCKGYLCNAASNLEESSYHVDAICVIFVYNALKLFYSFR